MKGFFFHIVCIISMDSVVNIECWIYMKSVYLWNFHQWTNPNKNIYQSRLALCPSCIIHEHKLIQLIWKDTWNGWAVREGWMVRTRLNIQSEWNASTVIANLGSGYTKWNACLGGTLLSIRLNTCMFTSSVHFFSMCNLKNWNRNGW